MTTRQTSPVEPTPPAPGHPAAGTLRPAATPSPAVARGGEGAQLASELSIPNTTYERPCETCGTSFRVRPCEVRKALLRGNNPPRFCSSKCQHEAYRGEGNPKWRGGRVRQTSGYVYAYAPEHPHSTEDGYVMEHRLVMERRLGRVLEPEEQVHHRNHIRDDNRIENLELMANSSAHREHHAYYEDHQCATCGAPVRRSIAHRRRWSRAFCSRKCTALAASKSNAEKARKR